MGLKLQTVATRQGWTWARDGARLFLRRPIAFSAMLLLFLLVSGVWMALPVVGVIALAALPLLSLGFMVASRSVLRGGPAHPGQFIEPLIGLPARRRSLLVLCGLYGVGALAVVMITGWIYGDAMEQLRLAIAEHGPSSEQAGQATMDPRISNGLMGFALMGTALSVPFWHAPALVLWGGQGVWQALFSSTLSLWRAKGAYLVYGLAWTGASVLLSLAIGLIAGTLGARSAIVLMVPALAITLSTAFYVSLWFSFVDCFGSPDEAEVAPATA
ncbi:MAG TPA: BPSS1780 family membrane protein, partial [Burkholderiaceae bacterium]|nr:BPSS1780 family membrane protein [Burkholderiaceae bacterium]